jgi:hypothetical protein
MSNCECTGSQNAYEQTTTKSGATRDSNAINVIPSTVSILETLLNHRQYSLNVAASSDFRHNAAVLNVAIHARSDNVAA